MLDYAGARSVYVAGSPSGQFPESAGASIKLAQTRWIDNTYDRRTGQLIAARIETQTGLAVQVTELYRSE